MAISIRSNMASLDAQRNLFATNMDLGHALNHLSSGYRITSAADDAAGLAISENLRSQVRGSNQAVRNAQDGISMVQTAEGGMNEQTSILQRMRELAVQGGNDTLSGSDRSNINAELQALQQEFNAISTRTKFNGQSLLNGSLSTTQSGGTLASGTQFNTTGGNSTIQSIDVSGAKAGDTFTLTAGTNAGDLVLTRSSDNVAQTVSLAAVAANSTGTISFSQLGVTISVGSDAGGKTAAGLATDLASKTITTAAASTSASAALQIGANSSDNFNVAFGRMAIDANGATPPAFQTLNTALSTFNTNSATNSATASDATSLLGAVDGALNALSTTRAQLGAVQNRLTHTISNLQVTSQNLAESESRIRDVDVATETARMTSDQVLMQAGVSVLAQANQAPQMALKLLQ